MLFVYKHICLNPQLSPDLNRSNPQKSHGNLLKRGKLNSTTDASTFNTVGDTVAAETQADC